MKKKVHDMDMRERMQFITALGNLEEKHIEDEEQRLTDYDHGSYLPLPGISLDALEARYDLLMVRGMEQQALEENVLTRIEQEYQELHSTWVNSCSKDELIQKSPDISQVLEALNHARELPISELAVAARYKRPLTAIKDFLATGRYDPNLMSFDATFQNYIDHGIEDEFEPAFEELDFEAEGSGQNMA